MKPSSAIITSEGYPLIAYITGLFLFLSAGACFFSSAALAVPAFIAFLLTVFTVSFFRNPERTPPPDEQLMVAPADGTVVYAGPSTHDYLGDCQKISIFMSVFNVHVNRSPVSGRVIERYYREGRFIDARSPRASSENEQSGLLVESADGTRVVVVQIAGLIARRILCYVDKGDTLERGKRYGMIRFGSRLDVYIPACIDPLVTVGQIAKAVEKVLARLASPSQGV